MRCISYAGYRENLTLDEASGVVNYRCGAGFTGRLYPGRLESYDVTKRNTGLRQLGRGHSAFLSQVLCGTQMKKILIVDNHQVPCIGLEVTLNAEPDLQVCGKAETMEEAIELALLLNPDLAVVDLAISNGHGLSLIKALHCQLPSLGILVFSCLDEMSCADRSIMAGARGYIMKNASTVDVVRAVRQILDGGFYLSSEVNERLLRNMTTNHSTMPVFPPDVLSRREMEVFELTGQGMTTREIAEKLELSIKTVESYRLRMKNKLKLHSAAELIQYAVKWIEGARIC
jgi:DNA-binding NarL/FixJ family response regulator